MKSVPDIKKQFRRKLDYRLVQAHPLRYLPECLVS
jgi:hypothetical protein